MVIDAGTCGQSKMGPPAQWLQWAGAHFRLGRAIGAHFKLSKIGPIGLWHAFLSFSDGKIQTLDTAARMGGE